MAASPSSSATSNPRPTGAPAPHPRRTHRGAPRLAPSAAAPWTWETRAGATGTPGASEGPGPDGATLCTGGCSGPGAGAWGAVPSGWKRVWCDGKGASPGWAAEGVGWAASWPGGSALPEGPSWFCPGSLGQDRGPSPWFWPPVGQNGTGPCDRCSRPPRQGLQPPSASLVFLYNKITGVTSVLVSGLALLGSLKREGGLRASGGTNKTGSALGLPAPWRPSQPGVPSDPGVLWGPAPLCSVPTSERRECPFLTAHGQDVSPLPGTGVTVHRAAKGAGGRRCSPSGQRDLGW